MPTVRGAVVDRKVLQMKIYRQIIKIGNSNGVTLPKKQYGLNDLKPKDWVEITIKKVR